MITSQQIKEISEFSLVAEYKELSQRDPVEDHVLVIWQLSGFSELNGLDAYLEWSSYEENIDQRLFQAFDYFGIPAELGDLIKRAREGAATGGRAYYESDAFTDLERRVFKLLDNGELAMWRKLKATGRI